MISADNNPGGTWGAWGDWSLCDRLCGGGEMERERSCQDSGCIGPDKDVLSCNEQACPPDGNIMQSLYFFQVFICFVKCI